MVASVGDGCALIFGHLHIVENSLVGWSGNDWPHLGIGVCRVTKPYRRDFLYKLFHKLVID